MNQTFAETIRQLRTERGLSQTQIAEQMYVTRSTVARWESGSRMPDAVMIARLAKCLGTNTEFLFSLLSGQEDILNIIMVDDEGMEGVYLSEMLPIVTGWNKPFVADEMLRGYCNEIADFMGAVMEDREAESCFELAAEVMKVL